MSFETINDLKKDIIGVYPNNKNEIIINSYLADQIINFGIMLTDETIYKPPTYEDIINEKKQIKLGNQEIIISGIMPLDLTKYEELKYTNKNETNLYEIFLNIINQLGNIVYVRDDFYDLFAGTELILDNNYYLYVSNNGEYSLDGNISKFTRFSNELSIDEVIINNTVISELNLDKSNSIGKTINIYLNNPITNEKAVFNLKIKDVTTDEKVYLNYRLMEKYILKLNNIDKIYIDENNSTIVKNIIENDHFINGKYKYDFSTIYSEKYKKLDGILNITSIVFAFITCGFIIISIVYIIN